MARTPQYGIRIEYRDGLITASPTARRLRWETVTQGAQQIQRLPDLVAGHGPYNALYRIIDGQEIPEYYLVEEERR